MKVEALYIYPIKSLQGIKVPTANVLEKGFEFDRRWMLVDEHGKFITQRTNPELSQIIVSLTESNIVLQAASQKIGIPLTISEGETQHVSIWDDNVTAIKAENSINDWLSEVLHRKCGLVYMPENNSEKKKQNTMVSFADGYPYLVLGRFSMDDLNSRMDSPLPIERFRPNIIFEGGEAYEEDAWKDFKIGAVNFKGIKPCVRCVFTTIDQETGKMGKEPLKTLKTYRNVGNGVIFGLNTIAAEQGKISVGDVINVLS